MLDAAQSKLGALKELWKETLEMASGKAAAVDPIFAAIEAHREAHKVYLAAFDAVPKEARTTDSTPDENAASDAAAVKLTTIQPTTFEGAMALLDYFAEVDITGNVVFPSGGRDGDEESAFAGCIVRNAARALRETVEE